MKSIFKNFFTLTILSILFILISSPTLLGQGFYQQKTLDDFLTLQHKSLSQRSILHEEDIEGSPYLNKEFVLGQIITIDSIQFQNIPLRYNIFNEDMEFMVDGKKYLAISNPTSILEIKIGDKVFIYSKKENKYGYYQLLEDGKIKLLLCYNVKFRQANVSNGINQARPPKFNKVSDTFYLKTGNAKPMQIKNKKDIDAFFGTDSNKAKGFIKSEKLNIRNVDELAKLVRFMNETK